MITEWADIFIQIAVDWKLKASRLKRILHKKEQWQFTDQKDSGKADQLEESAKDIEDIAYRMKREGETPPADPVEAEILKWEQEARRKIMQRDTPFQEMTLYARIYQLTRMVRKA